MKYYCDDCDATFEAPTDTDTVRCPGCGQHANKVTTPADSPLGPITPIRCPEPGCYWSCHGVPDKYADSRAQILSRHVGEEHTATPEPTVWAESDPLHAAIAAAVWEQCGTENSIVVDDPRTIAAVAATVARQILGTTNTGVPIAVDRADLPERLQAVLTERFTALGNPFSEMRRQEKGPDGWPASHPVGPHGVAEVLRELLVVGVQQPAPDVAEEPTRGCTP